MIGFTEFTIKDENETQYVYENRSRRPHWGRSLAIGSVTRIGNLKKQIVNERDIGKKIDLLAEQVKLVSDLVGGHIAIDINDRSVAMRFAGRG